MDAVLYDLAEKVGVPGSVIDRTLAAARRGLD